LQQFVEDLNRLYLAEPGLWKLDYDTKGFRWIDCLDSLNSVISFLRQGPEPLSELAVLLNLTPVPRARYRIGLPRPGKWLEVLNSDAAIYGGSNMGNSGAVTAEEKPWHNMPCSAEFTLPPLSIVVFRPERPVIESVASGAVAAGILPAVEGGILPPGTAPESSDVAAIPPGRMPGSTAGKMPAATSEPASESGRSGVTEEHPAVAGETPAAAAD
jgi:1,4-alpha-glucan branching enzyme